MVKKNYKAKRRDELIHEIEALHDVLHEIYFYSSHEHYEEMASAFGSDACALIFQEIQQAILFTENYTIPNLERF